jgi:hypothetical protein
VPLIAVASKCIGQENEIDESNVSKEDMKDEYKTVMKSLSDSFIKLLSFLLPFASVLLPLR